MDGFFGRLQAFWGVVAVTALLISLPWLPIESVGVQAPAAAIARASDSPAVAFTTRPRGSDHFVYYMMPNQEAATAQAASIDPSTAAVFVVMSAEDEAAFSRFILAVNEARRNGGAFEATVLDLR